LAFGPIVLYSLPTLHKPSDTALKARARSLLEAMSDRARWIYALPIPELREHLATELTGHGFALCESDREAPAGKWTNTADTAAFTVLEREDLEVALVEAHGVDAAPPLGALLEKTGFFAQSALLSSAYDVGTEDARKALTTLAHMVVAWDDDWAELFLLHLASPDPVVRHDAVAAVTIAAMVARDKGPAAELLAEAARHETYPKLSETIAEAAKLIAAMAP
jgi:hypothetical protein